MTPWLTPSDVWVRGPEVAPQEAYGRGTGAANVAWDEQGQRRAGLALCLSGGGYRATMMHVGALRRLDELGVLGRVDVVSGVSGGSLVAAALASPELDWSGERVRGLQEHVLGPLYELAGTNIRTGPLLAGLMNWGRPDAAVLALQRRMERALPVLRRTWQELGVVAPRLVVQATDLTFAGGWVFTGPTDSGVPARMGSDRAGFVEPPPRWTLGAAVATSSAIPPFFPARRVRGLADRLRGGRPGPESPERHAVLRNDIRLTDGGVYDNLAVEPVWKTMATLLVSDGGAVLRAGPSGSRLAMLLRTAQVAGSGATDVRLRWLHDLMSRRVLTGATWELGSTPAGSTPQDATGTYPPAVVEGIARVRTDYDAFADDLRRVLENHGYALADAAVRTHAPELIVLDAPFALPNPGVADAEAAARAVHGAHRRTLLGRF